MLRGSFRARLIAGAIVWIAVGIAASGFVLSELYREQVVLLFDSELDGHAEELARSIALDAEGKAYVTGALVDPRFEPSNAGWYWQIEGPQGLIGRSSSLGESTLRLNADAPAANAPLRRIEGPTGPMLLLERSVQVPGIQGPVRVGIGADERVLADILRPFNNRLGLSLGIVALGLVGAAWAQVAFGLRPLGRLRDALQAVRTGQTERLPQDVPSELAPLVSDLNALLDAQQAMMARARAQAGNLAHALKTPLAILMDEGAKLVAAGRREEGSLVLQECDRMRRHVDYQLTRARAAGGRTGSAPVARTRLSPTIAAVVAALSRLHRDRHLEFEVEDAAQDSALACEPDDLSEMLANLVDNAAKWARSRVRIGVSVASPPMIRLWVDDDGPGMPAAAREQVFKSGERLDEGAPGSGLGLAIVRDLAQLYGGRAWIEESPLGGVRAVLELPCNASPSHTP